MVKKVLCRVISSVPLDEKGGILQCADSPHTRLEDISFPVIYTGRLNIIQMFINETPLGQVLDCYA
jgi:hypothetical protein